MFAFEALTTCVILLSFEAFLLIIKEILLTELSLTLDFCHNDRIRLPPMLTVQHVYTGTAVHFRWINTRLLQRAFCSLQRLATFYFFLFSLFLSITPFLFLHPSHSGFPRSVFIFRVHSLFATLWRLCPQLHAVVQRGIRWAVSVLIAQNTLTHRESQFHFQ